MDEHKQHNGHDHSGHGRQKEDHSQHNAASHAADAAMDHSMHDPSAHDTHESHATPVSGEVAHEDHSAHVGHDVDHSGHEEMFRVRFWWCLLLSIPVLLYSGMIQMWLGFTPPAFPFSEWIPFVFSVIIFAYGGIPFLQMAVPELQERRPGMMTLITGCWCASKLGHLAFACGWRFAHVIEHDCGCPQCTITSKNKLVTYEGIHCF
jgi:Cu2+-exporting ATPase